MSAEKCPKCGAPSVAGDTPGFICGTYVDDDDGVIQYPKCRVTELERALSAANQRIRELTEWRPIDEDTPMDINLQLGWMEEWPEKRWRQEIKLAGHKNDKPPGMSNGWRHGQATHWLPLTPAPTNR